MRKLALVAAMWVLVPGMAHADQLDFKLYQLHNPANDPSANARFNALMNELGAAICNWDLAPPETTGFSGFNFAFEYPVTLINNQGTINGVRYWAFEGPSRGTLQMPGVHIRKGFPFSFEAGAKVNYISYSNMVATTAEAKWALNEGFIYFPDLGVRGFGTQLIGSRDFTLTVAGLDIGLGKKFPIAGMFTLTPYAGWSMIWVNASSNMIDFRPDTTNGNEFADPSVKGTGNDNVFDSVDLSKNNHNRFYGGIRLVSYVVEFGIEASMVQVKTDASDVNVVTYSGKLGLEF